MQSIATPILKQLEATNDQYTIAVDSLVSGNPSYPSEIKKLTAEAKKLLGSFNQVTAQLEASKDSENKTVDTVYNSLGKVFDGGTTIAGNQYPVKFVGGISASTVKATTDSIKGSTAFIISELATLGKILEQIKTLVGNITNLQLAIAFLIRETADLKKSLATELANYEKSLRLQADKIKKNAEWSAIELRIMEDELVARSKIEFYTDLYYAEDNTDAKLIIQTALDVENSIILTEIPARRLELENDKKYWADRWESEASND